MTRTNLLFVLGAAAMLGLSACSSSSLPSDQGVETTALRPAKPPKPPRPPVPTTPTTDGEVSARCAYNGATTTCTITVGGKSQVRTYDGQVSIRTSSTEAGTLVQILRDGQVIDEIRG